jgi:hypothetical protein
VSGRPLASSDSLGLLQNGLTDGEGGGVGGLLGDLIGDLIGNLLGNLFGGSNAPQGPRIYGQGGYGNPYDSSLYTFTINVNGSGLELPPVPVFYVNAFAFSGDSPRVSAGVAPNNGNPTNPCSTANPNNLDYITANGQQHIPPESHSGGQGAWDLRG